MNRKTISISLIVIVLFGALIFFRSSSFVLGLRSVALTLLSPVFSLNRGVSNFFQSGSSDASEDKSTQEKILTLQHEVDRLSQENDSLRAGLSMEKDLKAPLVGADVLLHSEELGKEFLILNRGSASGISEGNFVVSAEHSLVGIVESTGKDYSTVAIVSNGGSTLEVEIYPSRVRALLRGLGARAFSLELIPNDIAVGVGDTVVAPPKSAPLSFVVGTIVRSEADSGSTFKKVNAILAVDADALSTVFVLLNTNKNSL